MAVGVSYTSNSDYRREEGKYMNCRDADMCVFCKYWLGDSPNVDYRTGECKVPNTSALCSKDNSGDKHKSTDLCSRYMKALSYM